MEEILRELNEVFQLISGIPVTGDSVDAMAVARGKLRHIHAEIKKIEKEKEV